MATDTYVQMRKINIFCEISLISTKPYGVTIRWNRLGETIPTNGYSIGIC